MATSKTRQRSRKHRLKDLDVCRITPERARIKAIALAIAALMDIPSEKDAAECACPLADELKDCVEKMYSPGGLLTPVFDSFDREVGSDHD